MAGYVIGVWGIADKAFQNLTIGGLPWYQLAFIIFGISSFIVFGQMIIRIRHLEKLRPRIILVKTENVFGNVVTRRTGQTDIRERPWFARVQFANDPKSSLQGAEADIVGHIEFYDNSRQRCFFTMIGRWAETKEIADGAVAIEIDQIKLPPTGRPYIMDIGLKYHEEEEFYGYNNETPRKATVGFRDNDRKLPAGEYTIKVRLRGVGVDKEFWFILQNPGKDKEVELKIIS